MNARLKVSQPAVSHIPPRIKDESLSPPPLPREAAHYLPWEEGDSFEDMLGPVISTPAKAPPLRRNPIPSSLPKSSSSNNSSSKRRKSEGSQKAQLTKSQGRMSQGRSFNANIVRETTPPRVHVDGIATPAPSTSPTTRSPKHRELLSRRVDRMDSALKPKSRPSLFTSDDEEREEGLVQAGVDPNDDVEQGRRRPPARVKKTNSKFASSGVVPERAVRPKQAVLEANESEVEEGIAIDEVQELGEEQLVHKEFPINVEAPKLLPEPHTPDVATFLATLPLPLNRLLPAFTSLGCTTASDLVALSSADPTAVGARAMLLDTVASESDGGLTRWQRMMLEAGLVRVRDEWASHER